MIVMNLAADLAQVSRNNFNPIIDLLGDKHES